MFDETSGDPQKQLCEEFVHKAEESLQVAMTMAAVLGVADPREFVKMLLARVISHFYLSVEKRDGETKAQTWLEEAMGAVCEHFAHHGVNLKAVLVRPEAVPLPETPKPTEPPPEADFTSEERELLKRGHWINVIKSLRERKNLSLYEAKDLIDPYRPRSQTCAYCHGRGVVPA